MPYRHGRRNSMSEDITWSGIEGHAEDIAKAMMMKKSCAITKDVLKYLNNLSIKYGYNQQLIDSVFRDRSEADELSDVIDERFPLFLSLVLPHYHKQGKRTDLHYRTVWVGLLSKDREKERKFIVDIPATAFNLLPEVPQIKYLETKEWTKWWEKEKRNIQSEFIKEMDKLEKEGN